MSTFGGRMLEVPNVSIDRFDYDNLKSSCFFLSHCHSDHMKGLKDIKFIKHLLQNDYHLYCSPISKNILLGDNYFKPIEDNIIIIKGHAPVEVPAINDNPSYRMYVSAIAAGHCPGSVMFLLETHQHRILYTGDFRIAVGDVKKFSYLHDLGIPKQIDKIYFDATFFGPGYYWFPNRSDTVKQLCDIIQDWRSKDKQNIINLRTSANYGYENLFIELGDYLKCRLHVKDSVYECLKYVPEIGCHLTNDPNSTFLHVCPEQFVRCNAIQNTQKSFILTIRVSAQWCYQIPKPLDTNVVTNKSSEQSLTICYATHCSNTELLDFLNYLQPKELYPCTSAYRMTDEERDEYINELLLRWNKKSPRKPAKHKSSEPTQDKTYYQPLKIKPVLSSPRCDILLDSPPPKRSRDWMT